jgi:hypothetical protein
MTTYDLLHAAPNPAAKSGQQRFVTRDSKISGMQKAIQALTVALLSDNFPTNTGIKFIQNIKSGKFRDSASLRADFSLYKSNILDYLRDTSRPANEIIEDLSITDVALTTDKLFISFEVTFASNATQTYEMPIPL